MAENLGPRWRHLARVLRGERLTEQAARAALDKLLTYARRALEAAGMDPSVLNAQAARWEQTAAATVLPQIEAVFTAAYAATAAGDVIAPDKYATRHLEAVWNRLAGVPDEVFDSIRLELEAGRQAEEGIPQLAARVDALLSDDQRWTNRAVTIARTEVIGANNAGATASAYATADVLGIDAGQVVKEWLSTSDSRTRKTHKAADGQQVKGLGTPFQVGRSELDQPGDPRGRAEEVIQCRCAVMFHYPGDPSYPAELSAGADPYVAADATPTLYPGELPVDAGPQTATEHQARGMTPEELMAETTTRGGVPKATARAELQRRGLTAAAEDNICTCCGGGGEHLCGHECYVCDSSGQYEEQAGHEVPAGEVGDDGLAPGDPALCRGHHGRSADGDENPPPDGHVPDEVSPDAPPAETPLVIEAEPETEDAPPTGEEVQAALRVLEAFTSRSSTIVAAEGDTVEVERPTPDATGPAAADMPTDGEPFYGIIWPEDTLSGDSRLIAAGATTWRDLPLPLHYQDAIALGHDGAVRTGRIDTLTRDETTYPVPVIRYTGVWDTSEAATEARRQVGEGIVRGISVDGVSVTVELRDSDGQPLDPMVDEFPADGVVVEAATAAAIAGGTICSIPAFHQAYIANGRYEDRTDPEPGWADNGSGLEADTEPVGGTGAELEPVAASARPAWSLTASGGPVLASAEVANPGLTEPTRLTVTDDRRVFGHLAVWGTCHIGIDGICQEPPYSPTNCAYFNTGSVDTDAGRVSVGQLTMGTGHAGMNLKHRAAAAHYDNTGYAIADVVMGQDDIGYWFNGRLRDDATPEQVFALQAAGSVSGDWRDIGGHLELVAALVVNVPGFPIPVPAMAASGQRAMTLVASGVVAATEEPSTAPSAPTDLARTVYAQVKIMGRHEAAAARVAAHQARLTTARAQRAADRFAARRRARVAAAAARIIQKEKP